MLSNEVLTALHQRNRADKLRAVQFLVQELAVEAEALLASALQYEVWSPYDAPGAAHTLLKMLEADEHPHDAR